MADKNEYARLLGQGVYDETPKEVWAAIAVSYMSLDGDWPELAAINLAKEWQTLFTAEIVSQPVPSRVKTLAATMRQRLIDDGNGAFLDPDYDDPSPLPPPF